MKKTRKCISAELHTGVSKCPLNFGKVKGALIVPKGTKLPVALTGEKLQELCHADSGRVQAIMGFVDYGKEGGTPQTGSIGYGGLGVTGLDARKDTFTLPHFDANLNESLLKTMNVKFDVYYYDEDNYLYGVNDGSDMIAGYSMSTIYPETTPHPTSSEQDKMTVAFCHADAQKSSEKHDYVQVDFNIEDFAMGLTEVELVEQTSTKYKVVEKAGGLDRTAEFGSLIQKGAERVLVGATTATYDAEADLITITPTAEAAPGLKAPSALYAADIKGIVYVGTKSAGK